MKRIPKLVGIRDRLPVTVILILLVIVFYLSATAAGETGRQPWDMLAVFSFAAILIVIFVLIGLWMNRTFKRFYLRRQTRYLSKTPFSDAHETVPEILRNPSLPLPVREEDLWPPGELLHMEAPTWFAWFSGNLVASLTREELLVTPIKATGDELAPDRVDGEEGDAYRTRNQKYTLRYPTSDITRVRISHYGVTSILTVWIRHGRGEKRVLSMWFVEDTPRALVTIAKKAEEQGIAGRVNWALQDERKIFDKELERQFKRAAPNASVMLKGPRISDEDFSWLVR